MNGINSGIVFATAQIEDIVARGLGFQDGAYRPLADLSVSVLDLGFIHCDATYDVFHVTAGRAFMLDKHIERFFTSARNQRLAMPYEAGQLRSLLLELVAKSGLREALVWMILTRGMPATGNPRDLKTCVPRFMAYAKPYYSFSGRDNGVSVRIARTVRRSGAETADPRWKNFSWIDLTRAQFEAQDHGFDTALLLDGTGALSEGPGFNAAIISAGRLVMPQENCLPGVTAHAVEIAAAGIGLPVERRAIFSEELLAADEIFLTSTSGGIIPVTRLDNRVMPPQGHLADLAANYWQLHENPTYSIEIPF